MNCQYCNREIQNKGSLASHQSVCHENPNRVIRGRSPNAGAQKGSSSWSKGMKFDAESIQRSIEYFELATYLTRDETTTRKHAKRLLVNNLGHKCQICNTSEWMGQPVPLVCDHISGDSSDNRFENFRNVCCNCDAQLPTYKSKNRGRGRKYDREHYQKKVNWTGG